VLHKMAEDFSVHIHRPPVANTQECQGRQPVLVLFYLAVRVLKSAGRGKVTQVALVLHQCFQNLFVFATAPMGPQPRLRSANGEHGVSGRNEKEKHKRDYKLRPRTNVNCDHTQ
jgi:hypothetical protein